MKKRVNDDQDSKKNEARDPKKTKSSDHLEEDCLMLGIPTAKSNESESLALEYRDNIADESLDDFPILNYDLDSEGSSSKDDKDLDSFSSDKIDFFDEANHMAKSSSPLEEIDKELLALTSEIENMGFFEKYESHNISTIEDIEDQQAPKARLQETILKPKDYENLSKPKTKSQFRESSPS